MKLKTKLVGTHCNTWPNVNISVNNISILDSTVVESLEFETDVEMNDVNTLHISMTGKQFGPIWDTELRDGIIIRDKSLSIACLEFDEVDIIPILKKQKMQVLYSGKNLKEDYYGHKCSFHFDSVLKIEFTAPIYNWIITEKFIKDNEYAIDDKSFGSWKNKFNYEATRDYLDKIQKLL